MSQVALPGVAKPKRKGIFPGWLLLAAGGVMIGWGNGLQIYSFGVYLKDLIAHFGWSRAQVSLAYSFGRLEGGIEGPFGGIATDKWGPRAVNLAGKIMLGLGLCAMYFCNSLWQFYVIWIIASIGHNLGFAGPLDAAVANWFVKRRGLANALMRAMSHSLILGIVPLVAWLLILYGWRLAFLITGVGTLLIGVPLTWFFIKPRRPEYYGWLPDGKRIGEEIAKDVEATIKAGVEYAAEATEEVEFTVRQALRDRTFWICIVGMSVHGMVSPALTVHTIPLLTDLGVDPIVAAAAMGSIAIMGVPGRLLFGWLGDKARLGRIKYLVIATYLIQAAGLFILIQATNMAWVWAYLVVYGFGHGAGLAIWVPLRGRYWGRKAYATIQGAMGPFSMVAGVIAPVYAGWAYDTTGSYMGAFKVILVCLLVATVVMFFANPPKRPEKIGKITEVW